MKQNSFRLWEQLKAVLTLQIKGIFRQKQYVTAVIVYLLVALLIPLLYSFSLNSQFASLFSPQDVDTYPQRFSSTRLLYNVAVAYDDSTKLEGEAFANRYRAYDVVSNSSDYHDLVDFVEDMDSNIGVAFSAPGVEHFVINDYMDYLIPAYLGLQNSAEYVTVSAMPTSFLEQSKSGYIFTTLFSLFLNYADVIAAYFTIGHAESRMERRTAVIVYNGGNIYVWHFLWTLTATTIMLLIFCLLFAILAICQVKFALVNVLLWLPELIVFSVYNIVLVMICELLAKTKEQIQLAIGMFTLVVFVPQVLMLALGYVMPNWGILLLAFLPGVPFAQMTNAMCYNGYSNDKFSVGEVYNLWWLHWLIIVQLAWAVAFYFLLCALDRPFHRSICQIGTDIPATYDKVDGFFNKNVREECQNANSELLGQTKPSAVLFYNVKKHFAEVKANDGISLRIPQGKITGILGPNGSGKTTLINALFRAHMLDAGDVFINGQSVRKGVGSIGICLQDNSSIFEWLTVGENVQMYKAFARTPTDVSYFGLDEKQLANTLSGGMKRRLSLSCALVNKPEILVLDEPTAGVDPSGRKELWELIRTQAPTIISTTHMLDEASSYFDRVAFIMKGKLVCLGDVQELQGSGISCSIYGKITDDERYQLVGTGENRINSYRTKMKYSEVFADLIERKAKRQIEQFEVNAQSFDWIYLELSQQMWRKL